MNKTAFRVTWGGKRQLQKLHASYQHFLWGLIVMPISFLIQFLEVKLYFLTSWITFAQTVTGIFLEFSATFAYSILLDYESFCSLAFFWKHRVVIKKSKMP